MTLTAAGADQSILAHPVSGHPHVDVPLVLVAGGGAFLVLVVAFAVPPRLRRRATISDAGFWSWFGSLSWIQVCVRVLAVLLLGLAITAGRLGVDDELDNLAPALVVGVTWPVLVVASIMFGPVWRWVDPWDSLGRVFDRAQQTERPTSVWPAVLVAIALTWYLSAYPDVLSPRAVGTALALYTIVMMTGCVAVGRRRWLGGAEPIGITLTWMALLPRRRLADWNPPRGAEALLGVMVGGVLFGVVRRSEVWSGMSAVPGALGYATLGLVLVCLAFGGALVLMGQLADLWGVRPGIARAAVPALAGVIVVVSLERNRFFTSAQLLPGILGDPFGRGWDLFGQSVDALDPAPLGASGLIVVQLAVLVLACVVGAVVASLRVKTRVRRLPAAMVMAYLAAASVVAVAMH